MIKLSIKGIAEPKVVEKEFKGVVYLEQDGDNVLLRMKDNDTIDDWYILALTTNGTIEMDGSLPDDIGLQVDDQGRVLIESEE